MKFNSEKLFRPFSISIETEEEAVVLLNALASYSCSSMSSMRGNSFYSKRAQFYSDMPGAEVNKITSAALGGLQKEIG